MNNLKDIHNCRCDRHRRNKLFCQDFNEQFEGYTQHNMAHERRCRGCFVKISMNNLKDIHNTSAYDIYQLLVVNLLQSYAFLMKYTKKIINICIYQKKAVPLQQLNLMTYTIRIIPLCKHSERHASVALFCT